MTTNLAFAFTLPTDATTVAFSGFNGSGSTISVVAGGTAIPLTTQSFNSGFTLSSDGTTLTCNTSGNYRIDYRIRTSATVLMSSGVTRNGTQISSLVCSPGVTGTQYNGTSIIGLTAGDVLTLTFYGTAGTATLASGVGASLTLVRIS